MSDNQSYGDNLSCLVDAKLGIRRHLSWRFRDGVLCVDFIPAEEAEYRYRVFTSLTEYFTEAVVNQEWILEVFMERVHEGARP